MELRLKLVRRTQLRSTADHRRSGQHSLFQPGHEGRVRPAGASFCLGGTKAQDVVKEIKNTFGDSKTASIRINEVRFVAADPSTGEVSIAAQIAAQTLGPEFKQWLNDPQKLLQLIAAAEGAKSGGGGAGRRAGGQRSECRGPAVAGATPAAAARRRHGRAESYPCRKKKSSRRFAC